TGKVVEQGNVIDVFSNPEQEVTKKFVEQLMTSNEEDDSLAFVLEQVTEGKIIQLRFVGEESTNDTFISDVAKKYAVHINILQGKITQTQSGTLGTLLVQMTGDEQVIEESLAYIRSTSTEVEVIRDEH